MEHTSHGDVIKRLKRADGHLKRVIQMIEDERSCVDVAQQLHAVWKAVQNDKANKRNTHLLGRLWE